MTAPRESTSKFKDIQVLLRLSNDEQHPGLLLYIQDTASLVPAQLDQVVRAVWDRSEHLFRRHGYLGHRYGEPGLDERPAGVMTVRIRTDFTPPGKRPWVPFAMCPVCRGIGRIGFGRRLACSCEEGCTQFLLEIGAGVSLYCYCEPHMPRRGWRCRLRARHPIAITTEGWGRWVRRDHGHICECVEPWGTASEAVEFAESVADEIEDFARGVSPKAG